MPRFGICIYIFVGKITSYDIIIYLNEKTIQITTFDRKNSVMCNDN